VQIGFMLGKSASGNPILNIELVVFFSFQYFILLLITT
jgi:hypothetical protein